MWVIYVSFQPSLLEGIERQAQSRYLQQNSLHLKPYLHLQKLKKVNLSKKEKVRHKGVIFISHEKEIKKRKKYAPEVTRLILFKSLFLSASFALVSSEVRCNPACFCAFMLYK